MPDNDGNERDEESLLHSVALQTSQSILVARQRAEDDLVAAKDALEKKTQELADALKRVDQLYKDAMRAVRARDEVLAVVSHDLRNPLSAVLMSAHVIANAATDDAAGARTKKASTTIVKAVDKMTRLIGDLLDLATLEEGNPLSVDFEKHNLEEMIRDAVELFEPTVKARRLTLIADIPSPLSTWCDRDRIERVISNLLGNAVKFTREGGTINVGARKTDGKILVTVRDTGIGIPAENIPHIFDAYYQYDSQKKRGAGLGLSIAKGVVETHGGRIWVESKPGEGSTFYFTLPTVDSLSPPPNSAR